MVVKPAAVGWPVALNARGFAIHLPNGYQIEASHKMLGDFAPYAAMITGKLTKNGAAVSGSTLEFGIDDGPHKGQFFARIKTDSHGIATATLQGDGVLGVDTVYVRPSDVAAEIGGSRTASVRRPGIDSIDFFLDWLEDFIDMLVDLGYFDACFAPPVERFAHSQLPPEPPPPVGPLAAMRHYRDEVLGKDAQGQHLIDLYYDASPKFLELAVRHPSFMVRAHAMIGMITPILETLANGGRVILTQEQQGEIDGFLLELSEASRPRLRQALDECRRALRDPDLLDKYGLRLE